MFKKIFGYLNTKAGFYTSLFLFRHRWMAWVDEVIIDGGSHNRTLLDLLRCELPGIPVRTQEELGFSSDAKEAVAFAILANEGISGRTNNLRLSPGHGPL